MIRAADRWLIAQFQRTYLWLYDWTGVRVGVLTLVFGVGAVANSDRNFIDYLFLLWTLVASWIFYSDQANEHIERFNVRVQANIDSWARTWINGFIVVALVLRIGIPTVSLWFVVSWFMLNYVMTVKVRKRDPKSFWQRLTAEEGAT